MAKKQDLKSTRRKPKAGRDPGTKELPPELEGLPPLSEQELEPVLLPAKKRKHRHPVARAIVRLLLVAAVLTGGFAVWKNWDKLAPEALLDWIDMKLDGADKGDGFPYAISGDTVVAMGQAKNNLALLTDTSLLFINEKGGEIARRSHAYARPLLKTAGSYALVAERGGGRYQLETRRETVLNGKLEGRNILAASLQEDGRFALVTDTASQSYQSELDVFDRKGNVLFSWKSPRLLLTDVALSPDGLHLAAVGVTAEAGNMRSTLLVFDLTQKSAAPVEYSGDGLMLFGVTYFSGGTVAAVGDTEMWVVKPGGTLYEKHSYEGLEPNGYAFGEASAGIVLRHSGASEGGRLLVVNASGDMAYAAEFSGTFRHLSPGGDGFWLLTSAALHRAGPAGLDGQADMEPDGRMVVDYKQTPMVLGLPALTPVDMPPAS